jgi:hypothetical protein
MPDIQARIERFQKRADEYRCKAEQTVNHAASKHYVCLADSYLQLIEMERRRMKIRGLAAGQATDEASAAVGCSDCRSPSNTIGIS